MLKRFIAAIGWKQSRVIAVWHPSTNIALSLEWKAADLWIGAYVYTHQPVGMLGEEVNVYLIAIPTLVLHIAWREYYREYRRRK